MQHGCLPYSATLRAWCLAGALAIPGAAAWAQESSPELPGRATTEGQVLTESQQRFTKGKGPGRGNAYLERYEEDFSYLADPAQSTDFFDPLKYIPFDSANDVYLTLNGEARFRYDYTNPKNFGVATAATLPKKPGGAPIYTPATAVADNALAKQRYELGADLHLGPNFRLYGELYDGQQTGHHVGPTVPGNQRSDLAIENGFAELFDVTDVAKTGIRAGRQEIFFGNNLNIRANVSTNLPSPVFDGVRAYRDWGNARVDVFAYNVVNFVGGVLQDRDNAHTNLWGGYASYDLPRFALAGADARSILDLFYFGWRSRPFANGNGSGVYDDAVFETGGRIVAATSAGFVSSQDHRHTFGVRAYGDIGDVDYDWQAALQRGSYAGYAVDAWAFNTDSGYSFHGVPWKPRIGAHFDGASGGADRSSRSLQTYQPMYPNTQYYAPNNEITPTNFYDIAPRLRVAPTDDIAAEFYYAWFWRYSQADAIYIGAPWPGGNGANAYAVTTLARGSYIGAQPDLRVTWTITPHVLVLAEAGLFFPGSALRSTGGRDTTFLDVNLTFKF